MIWRYPDKPMEVTPDYLESLGDEWFGNVKLNGWRCVVIRDRGEFRAYTRHHTRLATALRRDDDFDPELLEVMRTLPFPDQSMIDGEWLGRRDVKVIPGESYWMFDILYLDGKWLGNEPLRSRFGMLWDIMVAAPEPPHPRRIGIVPMILGDMTALWKAQADNPLSEGIVAKRLDSTLIGDLSRSQKNPDWVKCVQEGGWSID